jgi:unsaturated chondroitin disaccharide hydrolase
MLRLLALFITLSFFACGSEPAPASAPEVPPVTERIDEIFDLAHDKYLAAATKLDTADGLPRNAWDDGTWRQVGKRDWTTGFFPGTLWQIYAHEKDPALLEQAKKWTEVLRENQTFDRNHDIGFIMYSSFGNALEQTGDEDSYLPPLLTAAKTGAGRFSEKTGTIRSWDRDEGSHLTIIDNMMNLHLFTFAAERTGDSSYLAMVRSHSDRTDEHHFRPDGSSYHVVDYDPEDGSIQRKHTHQGTADESAWARGQAWGIYGFLQMYEDLGEERYLERARQAADYFISRLPEDDVPYWDFDAPEIPNEEKDASAAAIAACAFIRMTEVTGEEKYREVAIRMLDALSQPAYLADRDDPVGGLIKQQTGNKPGSDNPRKAELSVNINYGDYYYLEALNLLDATM